MENLGQRLLATIMQLHKVLEQKYEHNSIGKAATMLQFEALNYIRLQSGISMKDIAEKLGMSVSGATQLVQRLIKSGFVKKDQDTTDRRMIHLILTKEGQNQMKNMEHAMSEKMDYFLCQIPPEDRNTLLRIHENLLQKLTQGS